MTWQPIETAPMNGAPVLVWIGFTVIAEFRDGDWMFTFDGVHFEDRWPQPTHWMPLPTKPETAA